MDGDIAGRGRGPDGGGNASSTGSSASGSASGASGADGTSSTTGRGSAGSSGDGGTDPRKDAADGDQIKTTGSGLAVCHPGMRRNVSYNEVETVQEFAGSGRRHVPDLSSMHTRTRTGSGDRRRTKTNSGASRETSAGNSGLEHTRGRRATSYSGTGTSSSGSGGGGTGPGSGIGDSGGRKTGDDPTREAATHGGTTVWTGSNRGTMSDARMRRLRGRVRRAVRETARVWKINVQRVQTMQSAGETRRGEKGHIPQVGSKSTNQDGRIRRTDDGNFTNFSNCI